MTTFDPQGSVIEIRGMLFGPGGTQRLRLGVDTGATVSTVSRKALERCGYNPFLGRSATFYNTERLRSTTIVQVRRIDALDHSFVELEVVAQDLPPEAELDGLLGLNAFRDRRLVIDFRAGEITLD